MKDIKHFESKYAVTKDGKVWSYPKGNFLIGRWLKGGVDIDGYKLVTLWKNNKQTTCRVHRLVCETYLPNPLNFAQVNHKNGVKDDNRLENLEWCSDKENRKHAFLSGLYNNIIGEKNYWAKLTKDNVVEIKKSNNIHPKILANKFGINQSQIYSIRKGLTWKSITLNN